MNDDYWSNTTVVGRLSQSRTFLRQLREQGQHAGLRDVSELLVVLEEILKDAPVTSTRDHYRNHLETIISLLRQTIRHTSIATNMESQDIFSTDVPRPPSCRADTSFGPAAESAQRDDFDTFASARRHAIEGTIISDTGSFPLFCDIAGLQDAKNAMIEALVDPVLYPDYFRSSDLKPWKSVLLYGPPGTGKTILSQAVVREINGILYQISSSDLISSWQGQSERLIRELFDHALQQHKTAVIFIDEVDGLCRTRSRNEDDANRRVKTELLVQIQRLQESSGLILICATNCPWELDAAFLRRLEKKIYAGLPDLEARAAILRMHLKKTSFDSDVDAQFLAQVSEGFSGDDLSRFATELAYAQFRKHKSSTNMSFLDGTKSRPTLSSKEVREVLEKFQPSVDSQQLALFQQFMTKR